MCLAIPARIVDFGEGGLAFVEVGGVRREISLALVEGAAAGDYVLVHAGYALALIDPVEAERTLALFEEMAAAGRARPGP